MKREEEIKEQEQLMKNPMMKHFGAAFVPEEDKQLQEAKQQQQEQSKNDDHV